MRIAIVIATLGVLLGGCADPQEQPTLSGAAPPATPAASSAAGAAFGMMAGLPTPAGTPSPIASLPRRIIYNAELNLAVARFAEAQVALLRLVKQQDGYVAESDIAGSPGAARSGRWVVRIPVDRLDLFEEGLLGLGELEKRHRDSRDVTAEYFDLDARIKNKQVEEARLLKHLADSTGSLKETLEVERELSRVREEIEQSQGKLQLLANLTSLSTVTIALAERDRYIPGGFPDVRGPSFADLLRLGPGPPVCGRADHADDRRGRPLDPRGLSPGFTALVDHASTPHSVPFASLRPMPC